MNTVLFTAAAVMALTVAGVANAAKPTMMHVGAVKAMPSLHPKATVLYDQTADDSGIGIVSQNFEKTFNQYDAQGADDFTVPTGKTWTVSEIDAPGAYFNGAGPAMSENVFLYKAGAKKGLPATLVKMLKIKGTDTTGAGSFAIMPMKPFKLKAGTYFLSIQVNMSFSSGAGEWGWETSTTASAGYANVWQNPGDGFVTGCTTYSSEDVCIPSGEGPEHLFKILGSSK